jgi:NADPH-dependent curcumin reductase CurA
MYVPIIQPGEAVRSGLMGEVVASKSKSWKVGQKVIGGGVWAEYCVIKNSPMLREAL